MTRILPLRCRLARTHQSSRAHSEHGLAMLLVLIALTVTTVLVGAALTSRESSPAIGANAVQAAEATWSAESAANFAVGAIAQSNDIESLLGGDDTLTSAMTVGNANVDVTVTNLLGDPPTADDREFIIRAVADVNGVNKTIEKHVTRYPQGDLTDAADPYLAEFAVFATEALDIRSASIVDTWSLSPEAGSSHAFTKIGAGFADAASISLDADVDLAHAGLYTDTDASFALETILQNTNHQTYWNIPLDVPALPVARPTAFDSLPLVGTDLAPATSVTVTPSVAGIYASLDIDENRTVVINESVGPMFQFDSIDINAGTMIIQGTVSVYVESDLSVDDGLIILQTSASSITFYVGGDVDIQNNAKVGIVPNDRSTGPGVVTTYVDPCRVRILALAPSYAGSTDPQWVFSDQSATIALVHNPRGRVQLQNGAVLFGHAVARAFSADSASALYYDPTLDTHLGYTTPESPLYDDSANPIPEFLDIINDAAALPTADGFSNKVALEYDTLESSGTLELIGIDLTSPITTITETLNLGGVAIY